MLSYWDWENAMKLDLKYLGAIFDFYSWNNKLLNWVEQSRNPIHHFIRVILITERLQVDRNTGNSRVQYILKEQVLSKNMSSSELDAIEIKITVKSFFPDVFIKTQILHNKWRGAEWQEYSIC